MKAPAIVAALCGAIQRANAAWSDSTAGHLLVNQTDTGLWKHVLDIEIGYDWGPWRPYDFGKAYPLRGEEMWTENFTCGHGAFKSMATTEIADVIAGEEIGFRTINSTEFGFNITDRVDFGYPFRALGPGQIYLSRAPDDDLRSYRGEGDWFKIAYAGPENNTDWKLMDKYEFNFTIPRTTPSGKYLLRLEYLEPHVERGRASWYINCALVNIIGPGGRTPKGFVKFPHAYSLDDPGLKIPWSQFAAFTPKDELRLLEYSPPGPPVWTGGG